MWCPEYSKYDLTSLWVRETWILKFIFMKSLVPSSIMDILSQWAHFILLDLQSNPDRGGSSPYVIYEETGSVS